MRLKNTALCLALILLFTILFLPRPVYAANVSISGPNEGQVGKTVTVNLGFPSVETVAYDITIRFDSSLLAYSGASNRSNLPLFNQNASSDRVIVGAYGSDYTTVSSAASVTFKVLGKGTAEIVVVEGSDGQIPLGVGAKVSINLIDPPAAPATTTKPTTTGTKPSTTTSASTQPVETEPRHEAETPIGERYDGVALAVPETSPGEDGLPESFVPQELKWGDKHLLAYVSEPLDMTLYWLADEKGATRFYYFDEEVGVFVPYYRTEWSARYFIFAVLAEDQLPEGFELTTVKVREVEVPGYRPSEDYYLSKDAYDRLLAGEEVEGERLPSDLYLVACHVNESEEKKLYLFDDTLDSLIRADLWLIPLAGSLLDPTVEPEPDPTETLPTEPEEKTDKPVSLFGFSLLSVLIGAGILILILLAIIPLLIIRARRAAFKPELTLNDLAEGEDPQEEEEDPEDRSARPELREPEGFFGESLTQNLDQVGEESDIPLESDETGGMEEEGSPEQEEVEKPLEADSGWSALSETLRESEKKRQRERTVKGRPPGIRPSTHRRPERDDPADPDEL